MTKYVRWITIVVLIALGAVLLTACGDVQSTEGGWTYHEFEVVYKDKGTMPCIGHGHALDCDWSQLDK